MNSNEPFRARVCTILAILLGTASAASSTEIIFDNLSGSYNGVSYVSTTSGRAARFITDSHAYQLNSFTLGLGNQSPYSDSGTLELRLFSSSDGGAEPLVDLNAAFTTPFVTAPPYQDTNVTFTASSQITLGAHTTYWAVLSELDGDGGIGWTGSFTSPTGAAAAYGRASYDGGGPWSSVDGISNFKMQIEATPVPEPATWVLLIAAFVVLGGKRLAGLGRVIASAFVLASNARALAALTHRTRHSTSSVPVTIASVAWVALLGDVTPAAADFTTLGSYRSVYTQAEVDGYESIDGPVISSAIGSFPHYVEATAQRVEAFVFSSAYQSSDVPASGTTISGNGFAEFYSNIPDPAQTAGVGFDGANGLTTPQSVMEVQFSITSPHAYSAIASLTSVASAGGFANSSAVLHDDTLGADVFSSSGAAINASGLLLPGTYSLEMIASVGNLNSMSSDPGASASWDINLNLRSVNTLPGEQSALSLMDVGGTGFVRDAALQFSGVSAAGLTSLVPVDPAALHPMAGVTLLDALTLSTDAVFDGPVTLGFHFDPAMLPPGISERQLRLFAYDPETGLQSIASFLNFDSHSLETTTDSLETFAIGVVPEPATCTLLPIGAGLALLGSFVRRQAASPFGQRKRCNV